MITDDAVKELASTGCLRAGINTQNFLLVSRLDAAGEPIGVAPSMARALGAKLGVDVRFVTFESAKKLGDAVGDNLWDVAFIGAEPARAERISFTAPYCEIEATYLVPAEAPLQSIDDIDRRGCRIATNAGSAYDLWLTRNIKNAEVIRAETLAKSREIFVEKGVDALAGLRPWLLQQIEHLPGSRILDGRFTAVQQSIGTARTNRAAGEFLKLFVQEAKKSDLVAKLIAEHKVRGLSVAPLES